MIGEYYECKYAGNCKYKPFEAAPATKTGETLLFLLS